MQAIIMAGGEGKRLRPLTDKLPKPLLPINGRPLLDLLIGLARENKADNIIVCAGYLSEKIESHVKKSNYGIKVSVVSEREPLGTAGPLLPIKDQLEDEFFVLYGDVYTTANLQKMLSSHRKNKSEATLLLHESDHPQDSTVVTVDSKSRITGFVEKPGSEWKKHGKLTSAALYVVNKEVVNFIEPGKDVDFARDVFPKMVKAGRKLYGYVSEEYTKDMGTVERYEEVNRHAASGKKIAAFLDRDGVINDEVELLTKPQQLKLIKGAAHGIRLLNEKGIIVVVVTNQPVVARNLITEEQLKEIHDTLLEMLEKEGAKIDAIYYCPHHPEKNHPEANNPKYRMECECRKPKTGMIDQAAKTFKIDAQNSYVVGDRTVDVQLGKNAGCTTILVNTGYGGRDKKHEVTADHKCSDLLEASRLIVNLTEEKHK